jgi:hypothetical protein
VRGLQNVPLPERANSMPEAILPPRCPAAKPGGLSVAN